MYSILAKATAVLKALSVPGISKKVKVLRGGEVFKGKII